VAITKQQILEQLKQVDDPELHRDLVSLGRIVNVAVCEGHISVDVALPGGSGHLRDQFRSQIVAAVSQLGDAVQQVNVEFKGEGDGEGKTAANDASAPQGRQNNQPSQESPQSQARADNPLPEVKHIVAVGAGKGGVGKSTVAVNLAVGLARTGATVGLLDADIYGPSLPTMLGLDELEPMGAPDNMIMPFEVHGIRAMTLGKLVEAEKPLIWRGPMAHSAFRQLATQTKWGQLDYLIIDLPPGTGDVPLTMSQLLPLTGAVVVCTPQRVAQDDARRAVRMFEQLGIGVLGIVENMSYFIGDDGKEYDIFGRGGAQVMAQNMDVPFLGMIPINMRLRTNSDQGTPTSNFENDRQLGSEIETVVQNFVTRVDEVAAESDAPTLNVH